MMTGHQKMSYPTLRNQKTTSEENQNTMELEGNSQFQMFDTRILYRKLSYLHVVRMDFHPMMTLIIGQDLRKDTVDIRSLKETAADAQLPLAF